MRNQNNESLLIVENNDPLNQTMGNMSLEKRLKGERTSLETNGYLQQIGKKAGKRLYNIVHKNLSSQEYQAILEKEKSNYRTQENFFRKSLDDFPQPT